MSGPAIPLAVTRTVKLVDRRGDVRYIHGEHWTRAVVGFAPDGRRQMFYATSEGERDMQVYKECPPGWEEELLS